MTTDLGPSKSVTSQRMQPAKIEDTSWQEAKGRLVVKNLKNAPASVQLCVANEFTILYAAENKKKVISDEINQGLDKTFISIITKNLLPEILGD